MGRTFLGFVSGEEFIYKNSLGFIRSTVTSSIVVIGVSGPNAGSNIF